MSLSFTAVDFETANADHGSVCAVGATKVRAGRIVTTFTTLVRPPDGIDEFTPYQRGIHGIGPDDVRNSPEWPAVYPDLIDLVSGDVIVAHKADFDVSVLHDACRAYGISPPDRRVYCTHRLAKEYLTLSSYSLPVVAEHLGIAPFKHHEPLADATATAKVLLAIAAREQIQSFDGAGLLGPLARSRLGRAPEYVVDQARNATDLTDYNAWLRFCLASPLGRATGGENCVICGQAVGGRTQWVFRDRHVCSSECNESLKKAAKKLWRKQGIRLPS